MFAGLWVLACSRGAELAADAGTPVADGGHAAAAAPEPAWRAWLTWDGGSVPVEIQDAGPLTSPVSFRAWFAAVPDSELGVSVRLTSSQAPVARTMAATTTDAGTIANLTITETRRSGPVTIEWLRVQPGPDGGTVELALGSHQAELAPPPAPPEEPKKSPAKAKKKKVKHKRKR